MKTYNVLYAEDVPHYAFGQVEARNDRSAVAKARKMDTDSFQQYEPDWDHAHCRRIVYVEGPDGDNIAEDIQLDEDNAFVLVGHREKIKVCRAADDLLEALEKACVLLDRIRETCHYENGLPVTHLEARDIEIIHGDAVTELPAIKAAIRKARAP